jgi:hypothetical protein
VYVLFPVVMEGISIPVVVVHVHTQFQGTQDGGGASEFDPNPVVLVRVREIDHFPFVMRIRG